MRLPICAILCSTALFASDQREYVIADAPAAFWRFDEARDCCADEAGGDRALAADRGTNVSLIEEGPRPPAFPNFEPHNVAADFTQAPQAYLRVKDPGAKSVLDFTAGETITVEAWVQCRGPLKDWQFVYIVGKGRTSGGNNQNWGLRLLGDGELARASFIFSGATTKRFHRWNSNLGFAPGDDWHHVAVTYEFGKPDSIRAWIDGRTTAGVWDDGGATTDAPVVDDDEVWIGSSMRGQASSTFPGAIDEIAIYRHSLGEERIRIHATRAGNPALVDGGPKSDASKVAAAKKPEPPPPPVPAIALVDLPKDEVRVEILEFPTMPGEDGTEFWTAEDSKKNTAADPAWDKLPQTRTEQWNEPSWLLASLPNKYNEHAVRTERSRPFLVRMAGAVTLPRGEHRLLLRALTGSRIAWDGAILATTPLKKINRQDNDPVPDLFEQQLDKTMPLLPPGHVEREVTVNSDGEPHVLVVESWIGGKTVRPEVGELLVWHKDGLLHYPARKQSDASPRESAAREGGATGQFSPHQENFVAAFLAFRKAEERESEGDTKGAVEELQRAIAKLVDIQNKDPNWQREMVAFRLKRSVDAVNRLGGTVDERLQNVANEVPPPQENFVTVFLMCRKADEKEEQGDVKGALELLRKASVGLKNLREKYPDWQRDMVEHRAKRIQDAIRRLENPAGAKPDAAGRGRPDGAIDPAQEAIVSAYLAFRNAAESEDNGDIKAALKKYREARAALKKAMSDWPDPGPGPALQRIDSAIERLERGSKPTSALEEYAAPLSRDVNFKELVAAQKARIAAMDARNRRIPAEEVYWQMRHKLARAYSKPLPPPSIRQPSIENPIDSFIAAKLGEQKPVPIADDAAFLRRVSLDAIGLIPTVGEADEFLADTSSDKRGRVIDRLLADSRWADHWTSYWQDVLAENPNILKGTLNNTGPFRWWIHESLLDNKPMDRFATELIAMEGSANYGGPAGFGIATQNDLPMAAKAQVIAGAFLANEMKCARCHDAVNHSFEQRELFQIAAMLGRAPLKVPETSLTKGLSKNSHVKVTLTAGESIEPHMPFGRVTEPLPGVLRHTGDSRELLAALLTDPRNERFPQVIVNRLWKQFMGFGIVEPVDDWETSQPSHPQLLRWLANELVTHDYDLKHVARLILNSAAYQRAVTPDASRDVRSSERTFSSQARRRLTAEQLLDSLMLATGQEYDTEMITFDPEARQNAKDQGNFGVPRRAWEFAALSNERDRPALAKPKAQIFADVLTAFGWRESRPEPRSTRDHEANIIQPALLANGTFGALIARAHDENALTALALREQPTAELARSLYLTLLSREPSAQEAQRMAKLLETGYATRLTRANRAPKPRPNAKAVSWASHLNADATTAVLAAERDVKAGPPPTPRLTSDWRDWFEDAVWVLLVSPEFAWVP